MVSLYIVSGMKSSRDAEQILQQNNVEYRKIDVEESNLLAEIDRTMGISKLPVLEINGQYFEGIVNIREHFS